MAIAGGGTGGHVFPGIAVADEIVRRHSDAEVVFYGTGRGVEARAVPRAGYPFVRIEAAGFLGRPVFGKVGALVGMIRSTVVARRLFAESRPDVVIGTGGYVSVAPVLAAWTMRIPTLLLEQNYLPGLANRALGMLADAVAVTYHESTRYFPRGPSGPRGRVCITGNPVRREIGGVSRYHAVRSLGLDPGRVTITVLGGSLGAARINSAVVGALNELLDLRGGAQFLHQTGERDCENVRRMYEQMGFRAVVAPFIERMADAYAATDVLVSRAGATTLAEATAVGLPAILVPYPHAAGHQELNARKLADAGGCRMLDDQALTPGDLAREIRELATDAALRERMRMASRSLGRPDAAQKVADLALSLVRMGGQRV